MSGPPVGPRRASECTCAHHVCTCTRGSHLARLPCSPCPRRRPLAPHVRRLLHIQRSLPERQGMVPAASDHRRAGQARTLALTGSPKSVGVPAPLHRHQRAACQGKHLQGKKEKEAAFPWRRRGSAGSARPMALLRCRARQRAHPCVSPTLCSAARGERRLKVADASRLGRGAMVTLWCHGGDGALSKALLNHKLRHSKNMRCEFPA